VSSALNDLAEDLPPGPAETAAPAAEPVFDMAAAALPESIMRIPVTVQIVLGTTRLPIGKVAELRPGATVTLDQKLGAPVTVLVNGREVARGELFVLDGEQDRLGVTITELAPSGSATGR
jgi:flagellar motor switch protein FliN